MLSGQILKEFAKIHPKIIHTFEHNFIDLCLTTENFNKIMEVLLLTYIRLLNWGVLIKVSLLS